MEGFLFRTAADLYRRYGTRLSTFSLLLPSRRARLFLLDALRGIAREPLWQPHWASVDDLMCEASGLEAGERLPMIAELYKIYSRYHDEPFDRFYFWGDMLLNDFDTIDKYMIDASMLFRNIADIRELETDVSYLTPEQLRIVRFWMSLGEEKDLSDEKRRFLAIWKTLGPIYEAFRARLFALGTGYTGMIHRAAVERIAQGFFSFDASRRFVVAGFNALSECEKRLFRHLQSACDAEFYWDYDSYYTDDPAQEAGTFLRENLRLFPPVAPIDHDSMRSPKRIDVISTPSNAVQCKWVARLLQEIGRTMPIDKRTAVVLTDENLLMPLLYALPEQAGRVNVTMGYPLRQTLAYTFVERLIELQAHKRRYKGGEAFYHVDVEGLLAHPYLADPNPALNVALQERIRADRRISVPASLFDEDPLLHLVFRACEGWRGLSAYLSEAVAAVARIPYRGDEARRRVEFLARIAQEIVVLHNSLEGCGIEIDTPIYTSLLRRHLQTLRIPFEGEPLEGLQVMGILETRNLDFANVILLSMTDDNFPGQLDARASFIPYNLRAAYGLPTPEHHEGVFAYYFYRLIQRAERVALLYCSQADEKSTGEPSRYIRQLEYESGFEIRRTEVGVDVNRAPDEPIVVGKRGEVLERLGRFLDGSVSLSPTAYARYAVCPLRFYFASVARLRVSDELTDEVDNPMFGTILHKAVQLLYARVAGEAHPSASLQALLRAGEVRRAVRAAVNEECLHDPSATDEDYSGNLVLVRDIVTRYIERGIIPYDAVHDGFAVEGVEKQVESLFPFDDARSVRFAGVADRIDRLDDGTLRVVDYKTGRKHLEFDGVEALFKGEERYRLGNILQTLLYAMMLRRSEGADAKPALYYVREMNRADYSPDLVDKSSGCSGALYSACAEEFERLLRESLCELFDPQEPFRQTPDPKPCAFCDFREICRR